MDLEAAVLERKIMGVLIRAARERAHRTPKEVALTMGISQVRLRQYEIGAREISLPELENLACLVQVSVTFFLSNETLARREPAVPPSAQEVRARRSLLATKLKQARLDAQKSQEECAQSIGRTIARYKSYEAGRIDIPISELERLARFLNVGMSYFMRDGLARNVGGEMPDPDLWARLPVEIRALFMDPSGLPFLRMAVKLRDLSPSKLQELGEILLVVR